MTVYRVYLLGPGGVVISRSHDISGSYSTYEEAWRAVLGNAENWDGWLSYPPESVYRVVEEDEDD